MFMFQFDISALVDPHIIIKESKLILIKVNNLFNNADSFTPTTIRTI
jgi:hypothetical protein